MRRYIHAWLHLPVVSLSGCLSVNCQEKYLQTLISFFSNNMELMSIIYKDLCELAIISVSSYVLEWEQNVPIVFSKRIHIVPKMRVHVYGLNFYYFKYLFVVQVVTCVEIIKYGDGTDIAEINRKNSHFKNRTERPLHFLPGLIVNWLIGCLKYNKH